MEAPQASESFPPEAQAVIARLRQELNERNQQVALLQQDLNKSRQLVLERDLQVIQLQAQATQRTQIQVPEPQATIPSQNDTGVARGTKRTHTEMEKEATGVPVVSNGANSARNDTVGSLPVDEQRQTQVAPLPMAQQVAQIHKAVTEMHGMMVTRNNEPLGMLGAIGSPAAFNAASRYMGPSPFALWSEKKRSNTGPFPVELWTRVLGFLPYSDVCRMTLVATVFREDIINTLKTLYIDNERALFHNRRYYGRNVQEVVFACIFEDFEAPMGDEPGRFTFQSWLRSYRWKLQSFLVPFRKLKYVFIAKCNGETKQEILCRLSLQGDVEAGYDYIDSIPRGHINFVRPRDDDDDGDDWKPAWVLEHLARDFFLDPILNTIRPVRMVYGLPRVHRGDSCLAGGCTHDGSKHVPRVESKVHPGMFLPC